MTCFTGSASYIGMKHLTIQIVDKYARYVSYPHLSFFFSVVILTVWHVFIIICSNIFVVCEDGFYNSSCTDKCGRCLNGEACDKRNGTCLKGCQPHFAYPLCRGNFISHNLKQSRS